MFKVTTKPREYKAISVAEVKEMIQLNRIPDDLPSFLARNIRTKRIYIREGVVYRRKLNADKQTHSEFAIDPEHYFVCTQAGPVNIMSMEQIKEQFNIVEE